MNYRKKIGVAIVLLVFFICAAFSGYVYWAIFSPNTSFETPTVSVYIPSNTNYTTLKNTLSPNLLNEDSFFKVAKQKGYLNAVRGGKFILSKGMNNNEIINVLRSKPSTISLSFNNQERLEDLALRVSDQIEADAESLLLAFNDSLFLAQNGFNRENALSMYLPNTYDFFWNTSAESFRDRMLKEYRRFWNSERLAQAKNQGLSPLEVIHLAAIVHKESVKKSERPRVAGVYLNRIKKGMKLQADPTVIFSIKYTSGDFKQVIKRVLYKDLKIDAPFNTYLYSGIPPGPIFMPDISAIEAVLNPEAHNYLYFVADIQNFGFHIFAKTLQQHNKNKKQYVNWLNRKNISR